MKEDNILENNTNKEEDDYKECTIEELLETIDELENRTPYKYDRKNGYSTTLEESNSSEAIVEETDNKIDNNVTVEIKKDVIDRKRKVSVLRGIFSIVKIVGVSVVIAVLINTFLITNALIPSGSMESTIMTGDRVIGFKSSYWLASPKRGDIVIFRYPDDETMLYIKRIIGLPGDKVEIIDGLVYINDSNEPLEEDYLSVTPKGSFGPYQVPDNSYFLLGDNRNVSKDSRYWNNTFVTEDKIIAKACFRYYPKISFIK